MTRYILIDNNTGYIWGDSADFADGGVSSISDAARMLDESLGYHGRMYRRYTSNPRTNVSGYDVYRADDAVPVVRDGQDQEMIEAVQRDCEYAGFVEYVSDDV